MSQLSATFGTGEATIYNWLSQERIDRGEIADTSTDLATRAERGKRGSSAQGSTPTAELLLRKQWADITRTKRAGKEEA